MHTTCLHITNGNNLTKYLRELGYNEDILTWQEMLCEGPTIPKIDSDEFLKIRSNFFETYYDIEINTEELRSEIAKLDDTEQYSEINLWFEYDLFCHINLIGVINLLHQKEIEKPIYLICSGRVKGEKNLKGLSELSPVQLNDHYDNKVLLTQEDKELAIALWRTYCGTDHNILKPYIVKTSNFKYMSNCLKAHLERFPHQKNGLSILEENILKLIKKNNINSKHHLLGYALNYQGYYGFGDMQLKRIINNLSMFFEATENGLELNSKGRRALSKKYNFAKQINDNLDFGGVNKMDFQFSVEENQLVKIN